MAEPDDLPIIPDHDLVRVPFNFQSHDWTQRGTEISCPGKDCDRAPHAHGHPIRSGLMLTGSKGNWKLEPEGSLRQEQPDPD